MSAQKHLWRDNWSAALWLFTTFLNLSFALALWAAFDTRVAIIDFLLTQFFLMIISQKTQLEISLDSDWLHVGPAKIELTYIDSIEVLTKSSMAKLRTRDANLDAYLDLRFWVSEGIKINLNMRS